jgi:hypothetical protein
MISKAKDLSTLTTHTTQLPPWLCVKAKMKIMKQKCAK